MHHIVTLTMNPTVDKSAYVDRVTPDTKLRCDSITLEPGGGGINVSRVLKRLGENSTAYYPSGGLTGLLLQQMLNAEDISQIPIAIEGLTRENLTVFEEGNGQQFRFVMPGPQLAENEWRQFIDAIEKATPKPEFIVSSGSLPPGVPNDFYAYIGQVANQLGAKHIIDTSNAALVATLEKTQPDHPIYLLKPNMRELGQLIGKEIESEEEQLAAARELIDSGKVEVIVVSFGAGGALMVTKDQAQRFRTPLVPIRSAVGAGDSMVAGTVFSLAQGNPIEMAVQYGIAAGAAAVMTPGTELCRKEDVERLYQTLIGS